MASPFYCKCGCDNCIEFIGGAKYLSESKIEELEPLDYVTSLTKALTFGTITGLVGCFEGFNTGFGTEAVGQATTQTVATLSIAVLIADFALTALFVPV